MEIQRTPLTKNGERPKFKKTKWPKKNFRPSETAAHPKQRIGNQRASETARRKPPRKLELGSSRGSLEARLGW